MILRLFIMLALQLFVFDPMSLSASGERVIGEVINVNRELNVIFADIDEKSVTENETVDILGEKGKTVQAKVVEISEVMTKLEPAWGEDQGRGIGIDGISVGNAILKPVNGDIAVKETAKTETIGPMSLGRASVEEDNRLLRKELEKKDREISEMRSLISELSESFREAGKEIAKKESKR